MAARPRANAATLRDLHDTCLGSGHSPSPVDTADDVKLSQKLSAYGLSGPLFFFPTDFLSDRYQKVVLRYGSSSFIPVTSGVPQVSVLGPILFLIYINDISDKFCGNITIKLFADDIKIYMELTFDDSE